MKEKIIRIVDRLIPEFSDVAKDYIESRLVKVTMAEELEILVNQEVERRIKKRLPSEEDAENAESRYEDEQNEDKLRFDTEYCYRDYMNGWEDCRSRLTNPVK